MIWLFMVPQAEALFHIHVDTDTQSYCNRAPRHVLSFTQKKKKR